jgi:phosphoribosylformylglycinamidine synthase
MALLGWVPGIADLAIEKQPRFIRNTSGRFESRFPTVRIDESPAIMLKSMAGSQLGIWTAHGEGRLYVPDADLFEALNDLELMPIRYVDLEGRVTSSYPANPNGSAVATAALCSPDGRHLAMMPHPERCFLKWQWPWMSGRFRDLPVSPWLQLFQNAYDWVMNP